MFGPKGHWWAIGATVTVSSYSAWIYPRNWNCCSQRLVPSSPGRALISFFLSGSPQTDPRPNPAQTETAEIRELG